jgi:hypothetical protein
VRKKLPINQPNPKLICVAYVLNHPPLVLVLALLLQWIAAYAGELLRRRSSGIAASRDAKVDPSIIVSASLTLLALIIGFCFAMAIDRYDQRKNYEEAEANAIGTEYLRAHLVSGSARVRELLAKYTEERIRYYRSRDEAELTRIAGDTTKLQNDLWAAVEPPGQAQPNPVVALVINGMNDVLNSQGYTQAAWRNRVPPGAWILMILVAISSNLLHGYSERRGMMLLVLPLIVSIPLYLIADMDSPRGGIIRVVPQNLLSLQQSFGSP